MVLADLPRLLLRRWYAVLLGLVGCAVLGVMAVQRVPPTVQMTATVVMLPPTHEVGTGGNPYLALTGLESTADVVARRVTTPAMQDEMKAMGVGEFTVVRDQGTAAPMILVSVTGTERTQVADAVDKLVAAVPIALSSLQASVQVPPKDQITSEPLSEPSHPVVSYSPQLRAVLVIVAGGLLLTLALTSMLDLVLARLRRRREGGVAAEEEDDASSDSAPTLERIPRSLESRVRVEPAPVDECQDDESASGKPLRRVSGAGR